MIPYPFPHFKRKFSRRRRSEKTSCSVPSCICRKSGVIWKKPGGTPPRAPGSESESRPGLSRAEERAHMAERRKNDGSVFFQIREKGLRSSLRSRGGGACDTLQHLHGRTGGGLPRPAHRPFPRSDAHQNAEGSRDLQKGLRRRGSQEDLLTRNSQFHIHLFTVYPLLSGAVCYNRLTKANTNFR